MMDVLIGALCLGSTGIIIVIFAALYISERTP